MGNPWSEALSGLWWHSLSMFHVLWAKKSRSQQRSFDYLTAELEMIAIHYSTAINPITQRTNFRELSCIFTGFV
jgi:hypothetical protein